MPFGPGWCLPSVLRALSSLGGHSSRHGRLKRYGATTRFIFTKGLSPQLPLLRPSEPLPIGGEPREIFGPTLQSPACRDKAKFSESSPGVPEAPCIYSGEPVHRDPTLQPTGSGTAH